MTVATYYDILSVSPRASDADVRRAYKIQAMRWHPDHHPLNRAAAERVFAQISRAYDHIKSQPQRDAYNLALLKLMQRRHEAATVFGRRRTWPPRDSKSRKQAYFRFGRARRAPLTQDKVKDTAYGR
jgi:DnaJ-class molecular chaperone